MTDQPRLSARMLAANERKQKAYAARRRAWMERWLRGGEDVAPEPPISQDGGPAQLYRGGRTTIHDKRQGRLDL